MPPFGDHFEWEKFAFWGQITGWLLLTSTPSTLLSIGIGTEKNLDGRDKGPRPGVHLGRWLHISYFSRPLGLNHSPEAVDRFQARESGLGRQVWLPKQVIRKVCSCAMNIYGLFRDFSTLRSILSICSTWSMQQMLTLLKRLFIPGGSAFFSRWT